MLNKSLISCLVLRLGGIFCRSIHVTLTAHRICGRKRANKTLRWSVAAIFTIAAGPNVSTAIQIIRIAVQGHLTPRQDDVRKALSEPFARSVQIETIKLHHLGPGSNKVADERRQSIITRVDFRQRTQLRV